jgi:hypothetical protein
MLPYFTGIFFPEISFISPANAVAAILTTLASLLSTIKDDTDVVLKSIKELPPCFSETARVFLSCAEAASETATNKKIVIVHLGNLK